MEVERCLWIISIILMHGIAGRTGESRVVEGKGRTGRSWGDLSTGCASPIKYQPSTVNRPAARSTRIALPSPPRGCRAVNAVPGAVPSIQRPRSLDLVEIVETSILGRIISNANSWYQYHLPCLILGKLRKIGSVKLAYLLGVAVERSAVRLHVGNKIIAGLICIIKRRLRISAVLLVVGKQFHRRERLAREILPYLDITWYDVVGHPRPNTPRPLHGRIGSLTNLVIYKLSPNTTLGQLFALFDAPQHQPLLFYYARAHLLRATRVQLRSAAAEHIALVAALYGLLKEEGLRWDGPDGEDAFGNTIVFLTLRELVRRVQRYPRTPGVHVRWDPIRAGSRSLHTSFLISACTKDFCASRRRAASRPVLLRAVEDPIQPEVWETLWTVVLRCEEEMAYGAWGAGSEDLAPFKDAARTIAADDRCDTNKLVSHGLDQNVFPIRPRKCLFINMWNRQRLHRPFRTSTSLRTHHSVLNNATFGHQNLQSPNQAISLQNSSIVIEDRMARNLLFIGCTGLHSM
ncbi:hypothetical protein B0H11DRAFT_2183273 [Mycena galericulata]|nr:hypothetical protein B0H11DRAFT_2183273 [Mycena galericulata]